jgi:5-methyltetrahydrofolate--homocysteine methyltransferase
MEENLDELNTQGIAVPVLLGGAALTRQYCEGHLRSRYRGRVYYGKDAFEGLRVMDHLVAGKTAVLDAEIDERLGKRSEREAAVLAQKVAAAAAGAPGSTGGLGIPASSVAVLERPRRSAVATDVPIPAVPFLGSRVVTGIDLDQVYAFINKVALFRGQWQYKKKPGMSNADFEAQLDDDVEPIFQRLVERCKRDRILQPAVVYGYFPCNADGDDLVVWDPACVVGAGGSGGSGGAGPLRASGALREVERFTFPRQEAQRRLCISDFFRPVGSGEVDVIAMHCVTMGERASAAAAELFAKNDYTEYLYLHGLGVEAAEGLAEMWHKRIRQEMGIANEDAPKVRDLFTQKYRGGRYSFGYPACPEMSDQDKLFRLLRPDRIGCTLTDNWQIVPEQSTSAIIAHHPEAKYFNT